MTQVVDKKPADPILVDLSGRFAKEYYDYQECIKQTERKHKNAGKALDRELYALVGLKPNDKVLYKGEKYIVEDISMPFLAEDDKDRMKVYVTMHKLRCTYSCIRLLFNENEEIIKL